MVGPIRSYEGSLFEPRPTRCLKCDYAPPPSETEQGLGLNVEGLCIACARPVCPLCVDFVDRLEKHDAGEACAHCIGQCQDCIKPAVRWSKWVPYEDEKPEDVGAILKDGKVGRCEACWRKVTGYMTRAEKIAAGIEVPELLPDTPIEF